MFICKYIRWTNCLYTSTTATTGYWIKMKCWNS